MTYVLEGRRSYVGHGRAERRLGDRLTEEDRKGVEQVYLIHSLDLKFGKEIASSLEATLGKIAISNGVPLANAIEPAGPNGIVVRSKEIDELALQARALLSFAACTLFERLHSFKREGDAAATGNAATGNKVWDDMRVVDPSDISIPSDAVRMQLTCGDLQAQGYTLSEDRFLVLPGAEYSYVHKSGLSSNNRERRARVEHMMILERLLNVADRGRLLRGVDFITAPIAAKVLSGQHVGNAAWQPVVRSARASSRRRN
jgi:hypothetical protein